MTPLQWEEVQAVRDWWKTFRAIWKQVGADLVNEVND